jgi:uncharacterized repeat protein (TIGR02543 family)
MLKKIRVLSIVLGLIVVLFLSACNNNGASFEINFDTNGGSTVKSITYDGSNAITIPDNPTKEGYIFDGWFWDNETFENPFIANSLLDTPIEDEITLYAKWNINSYTLTFKDYDDTVLYEESYDYNTDLSELVADDPTREGYTFDGWDQSIPLTMPANDLSIKATYTINQYTITFDSNEGTNVDSITQDYGTVVTEPNEPSRVGYTFGGWYLDEALSTVYSFTNMPAEDITLYAKWSINQYTLTFRDHDDTVIYEKNYSYNANLSGIIVDEPIREGYTFSGWDQSIPLTMPANDLSIKATYTINQYTITFETNGGTEVSPVTQNHGSIIKIVAEKEGYTFLGWYNDPSLSIDSFYDPLVETVVNDLLLYAKWQIIVYNIIYVMNENTSNDSNNPRLYNITSDIVLAEPTVIEGTFIGWYLDVDNTVKIEKIFNMTGDLTLYSNVEMNQYTITFVTNGGTEILPISLDYGHEINSKTTRDGYIFVGWCISELLDVSISIKTMPNQNLTVYAKWAQMHEFFTIDNKTFVYYGNYPQSVVGDPNLHISLTHLSSTNSKGYYEFQGKEYAKVITNPYGSSGYQFTNETIIQKGQMYFFEVEPIKWRIIQEVDGKYTLLSEYIIDAKQYRSEVFEGSKNNYELSDIRIWLNNSFYSAGFTSAEKASILTRLVENSASTTESPTNPYASNDTLDKVYLLSYQDAINNSYGFSTNETRQTVTTDYARAIGISSMSTDLTTYGYASWWLRSPDSYTSAWVNCGGKDGRIISLTISSLHGVRPAIQIS